MNKELKKALQLYDKLINNLECIKVAGKPHLNDNYVPLKSIYPSQPNWRFLKDNEFTIAAITNQLKKKYNKLRFTIDEKTQFENIDSEKFGYLLYLTSPLERKFKVEENLKILLLILFTLEEDSDNYRFSTLIESISNEDFQKRINTIIKWKNDKNLDNAGRKNLNPNITIDYSQNVNTQSNINLHIYSEEQIEHKAESHFNGEIFEEGFIKNNLHPMDKINKYQYLEPSLKIYFEKLKELNKHKSYYEELDSLFYDHINPPKSEPLNRNEILKINYYSFNNVITKNYLSVKDSNDTLICVINKEGILVPGENYHEDNNTNRNIVGKIRTLLENAN